MPDEITRAEFLDDYFDYASGDHLLMVSPTGGGKTHFAYQLIEQAMKQNPHLTMVSLMPKPRDPSTVSYAQKLNLRETPVWPPKKKLFEQKPNGYVLWPRHPENLSPDECNQVVGDHLRSGIDGLYKQGNSIAFLDDASSAAGIMKLNPYIERTLQNGRSGGAGVWLAVQQPKGSVASHGVTGYAYNNSTHLFFGKDYVQDNLDRMSEIGGVDPKQVEGWVRNLRTWRMGDGNVTEWLYLDKRGPYYLRILPW